MSESQWNPWNLFLTKLKAFYKPCDPRILALTYPFPGQSIFHEKKNLLVADDQTMDKGIKGYRCEMWIVDEGILEITSL